MVPSELLQTLIALLEGRQIRYFITGSMATITYGDPRFTNDIDAVVELSRDQVDAFCQTFSAPDYYCSKEAALHAIEQRFQFNVIHLKSGLKIDVIIPDDSEFSRSCFARRLRLATDAGHEAWFSSPEDVIVKKMEFYREGGAEKHIRDIVGVVKMRADKLDRAYIQQWAERLQLTDIWRGIEERVATS